MPALSPHLTSNNTFAYVIEIHHTQFLRFDSSPSNLAFQSLRIALHFKNIEQTFSDCSSQYVCCSCISIRISLTIAEIRSQPVFPLSLIPIPSHSHPFTFPINYTDCNFPFENVFPYKAQCKVLDFPDDPRFFFRFSSWRTISWRNSFSNIGDSNTAVVFNIQIRRQCLFYSKLWIGSGSGSGTRHIALCLFGMFANSEFQMVSN